MTEQSAYPRIDEAVLIDYAVGILRRFGAGADDARITAEVLAASDVRGIESHGVARMEQYVKMIEAGMLDPTAQPVIVRQSGATALVDAQNGLGQVAGVFAMRLAIGKARVADVGGGFGFSLQPLWDRGLLSDDGP